MLQINIVCQHKKTGKKGHKWCNSFIFLPVLQLSNYSVNPEMLFYNCSYDFIANIMKSNQKRSHRNIFLSDFFIYYEKSYISLIPSSWLLFLYVFLINIHCNWINIRFVAVRFDNFDDDVDNLLLLLLKTFQNCFVIFEFLRSRCKPK